MAALASEGRLVPPPVTVVIGVVVVVVVVVLPSRRPQSERWQVFSAPAGQMQPLAGCCHCQGAIMPPGTTSGLVRPQGQCGYDPQPQ